MRFAHQCLANQLQQQRTAATQTKSVSAQQQSTSQLHVPSVYLSLLEGALTRDATSELVAAALQVCVFVFEYGVCVLVCDCVSMSCNAMCLLVPDQMQSSPSCAFAEFDLFLASFVHKIIDLWLMCDARRNWWM